MHSHLQILAVFCGRMCVCVTPRASSFSIRQGIDFLLFNLVPFSFHHLLAVRPDSNRSVLSACMVGPGLANPHKPQAIRAA